MVAQSNELKLRFNLNCYKFEKTCQPHADEKDDYKDTFWEDRVSRKS